MSNQNETAESRAVEVRPANGDLARPGHGFKCDLCANEAVLALVAKYKPEGSVGRVPVQGAPIHVRCANHLGDAGRMQ